MSGVLIGLVLLALLAGPAQARNVPGSASVAQPEIDTAVASSIIDSILANACVDFLRKPFKPGVEENRPQPCAGDLTVSLGGGARVLHGSPDGYDYDFASAFSHVIVSGALSPTSTLFGGVVVEGGTGILHYNDGTLQNFGVGAVAGTVLGLGDNVDLSLLGGAELLKYSTTRSGGLFIGDYTAVRYFADARLRGLYDGGTFYIEYGGGLRFVHEQSASYREYSGGIVFANVPASQFSRLTGVGNVKLALPMGEVTPYLEASTYLTLFDDSPLAKTMSIADGATFRLGTGANADVLGGELSLATGVFLGVDGYEGFDALFNFSKSF
jgi:hypothetical protein